MKKTLFFNSLLFGLMVVTPAWPHHAAEGIVSDEIWQMIDDNLVSADSPHLDIDFADIMNSMSVFESDDGDLFLMTSIVVPSLDVDEFLLAMEQALADANQLPSGKTNSGTASTAWFDTIVLEDGMVEILLFEPIGAGNSQTGANPGNGPTDEIPGDANTGDEQGGKRADEDPGSGDPGGDKGKGG